MLRLGIVVLGVTAGYGLRLFWGVPESDFLEPAAGGTMRPQAEAMATEAPEVNR